MFSKQEKDHLLIWNESQIGQQVKIEIQQQIEYILIQSLRSL